MINGNVVKFTKVTGWTDGPLKPTVTDASGTAAQVKTAVDNVLNTLGSMSEGEAIHVIITVGPSS